MHDIYKCWDCGKLFTEDEVHIVEEFQGFNPHYIKMCPYCYCDEFKEIDKYPYLDCDTWGSCDLDCDNCPIKRAENPLCKNNSDCEYDCDNCKLKDIVDKENKN